MSNQIQFTEEDKNELKKLFVTYTREELSEFIAKSIAEQTLLICSMGEDKFKDEQIKIMLGYLKELTETATTELKKYEVIKNE